MSKQVDFFISSEELPQVEQALQQAGDFVVLADRSNSSRPRVMRGLSDFEGAGFTCYLVRPQDLGNLRTREIPGLGGWSLDEQISPIIEFVRCVRSKKGLSRGRMYAQTSYYDAQDNLCRKDAEFIKWLDRLLRREKRLLEKEPDSFFCLSDGARQLQARGVTLKRF